MEKATERTGVTISIRDLLLYLCSRWRVLIIWLVIGAILGGAYSGYKSLKTASPVADSSKLQDAYESMSAADQANVKNNITTFIHYLNEFEYYSKYDEKSVFQKLDPESAKVGVLTYYIETSDDNTVQDNIVRAYAANMLDDTFAEEVAKTFGIPGEEAFYYYDGIVRVGDSVIAKINTATDIVNAPLLIRIYGPDDEFVNKMIPLVKDAVKRFDRSLSGSTGKHSATLISETVKKNNDDYIFDKQEENITNTKQLIKNATTLRDSLDADLLKVVEYYIAEQYDGEYLDLIFPGITEETIDKAPSLHISKKWVLVGAAGFLILAILAIIIKYLVKGVVRCYDDIEYTYGIQVLGTYDDPKTASKEHKTKLDKWLKSLRIKRKIQDRDSSVALIAKKLQLLAKKNDMQNICVAMGPDVDTDETFMNEAAEKADGINVTVASNILRNADAITKMLEADGVVLLEQMDRSRFSSIDQERIMCAGNNIKVLGAIVAE